MKRIVIATALLLPISAQAGHAVLTWSNPTQNSDNTPIPATGALSLASTSVEYFQCSSISAAWPATPTTVSVPNPSTAYTVTGLPDGQRFCFRVKAVNLGGTPSPPSEVDDKLIEESGPIVLTVKEPVAYRMRQSVDGFEMVAMGAIPLGTVCNDKTVDGYNLVPRAAVTPISRFDTLPLVVFARCG